MAPPLPITFGAASARGFGLFSAPVAVLDEYFENVTLLLPGNGTNGAQNNTFLDSSTNNFTITRNGNTTQGTFSPYGDNWSNYFDGTGDYLSAATNSAFDFGSGAFTIECWVYINSFPAGGATTYGLSTIYASGDGDASTDLRVFVAKGSTLSGYTDGVVITVAGAVIATSGSFTFNTGQWYHVAVTRSSNSIYIFIDGVLKSTTSYSSTIPNATTYGPSIGTTQYRGAGLYFLTGYISNVRVLKGTAQYTSTFTPPTAPLTAITNTSLLTCQSNRFIDNSTNAFTITRNGDVSVQRFSPFSPTASYASGTIGGSGYFDGSGDYLSVAANSALAFGTGNFTIEGWFYLNATAENGLFNSTDGSTGTNGIAAFLRTDNILQFSNYATVFLTSSALATNSWHHYAIVRSGTTLSMFVDGARTSTTTNSTSFTSNISLDIGRTGLGNINGYQSNLRMVKGTAVYDPTLTTLTIPTAPLTAITNTSLLCNFTNAGIIDNAMMNDLETVGNAQISTTQSKFGGSSMYFDGSGDYLLSNSATTNLYAFGTGDFTVEFWVRYANVSGIQVLYDGRPSGIQGAYPTIYSDAGSIRYYANTADRITGSTLSTNVWYHIAVARSGTSTKLFIDGTQAGTTYTDSTNYLGATGRPSIGDGLTFGTYPFNGYIDDLRITKGVARYTANFTPPTAAFPTR